MPLLFYFPIMILTNPVVFGNTSKTVLVVTPVSVEINRTVDASLYDLKIYINECVITSVRL